LRSREARLANYGLRRVGGYRLALIQLVLGWSRRDEYLAERMMLADGAGIAIVMTVVVSRLERGEAWERTMRKMCVSVLFAQTVQPLPAKRNCYVAG